MFRACILVQLLNFYSFRNTAHGSIMVLVLCLSCAENLKNVQTKGKHYIPNFIVLLLIPFFRSSCLSFARRLDRFLRRLRAGDTLYFLRAVFLRLLDIKSYSGWLKFHAPKSKLVSFYEAFSVPSPTYNCLQ